MMDLRHGSEIVCSELNLSSSLLILEVELTINAIIRTINFNSKFFNAHLHFLIKLWYHVKAQHETRTERKDSQLRTLPVVSHRLETKNENLKKREKLNFVISCFISLFSFSSFVFSIRTNRSISNFSFLVQFFFLLVTINLIPFWGLKAYAWEREIQEMEIDMK